MTVWRRAATLSALIVFLGLGAALLGGTAHAETTTESDTGTTSSESDNSDKDKATEKADKPKRDRDARTRTSRDTEADDDSAERSPRGVAESSNTEDDEQRTESRAAEKKAAKAKNEHSDADAHSPRVDAPAAPAKSPKPPLSSLPPRQEAEAVFNHVRDELHTAYTHLERHVDSLFRGYPPPGTEPGPVPSPNDVVETAFGDIGKWMLAPTTVDGEDAWKVSDWLGQKYGGRNLVEPINVVIVDRTSTTAEESLQKLTTTMATAGFPARTVHSYGYEGNVDGIQYPQQPSGVNQAFSNCFYLLPNDHGRVFGPAPAVDGVGFVWTAALSRERVGIYDWHFTHRYVSFNRARNTLRDNLVRNGATDLGTVNLGNAVNSQTQFTGDHDGLAVVIELA